MVVRWLVSWLRIHIGTIEPQRLADAGGGPTFVGSGARVIKGGYYLIGLNHAKSIRKP